MFGVRMLCLATFTWLRQKEEKNGVRNTRHPSVSKMAAYVGGAKYALLTRGRKFLH